MTTRWIRKLLRAWPRNIQAPKRAESYAELPPAAASTVSGRENFRTSHDDPRHEPISGR